MDVLVTGSSGLIGGALVAELRAAGHRVVRLVRSSGAGDAVVWDPTASRLDPTAIEGLHAVVHLAGEGIGEKKWSPAQKHRILESRVRGTELLATTLASLEAKPSVLVSASAIGYYGGRGDEELTEDSAPGSGFLADVCRRWEGATVPAAEAGIRVVHARTGIVLSTRGGVLARMLVPFRLGLGGRIGSGRQYMSWISLDDEVGALLHVLTRDEVRGAVNLTAPTPVTNREFTETLGRVLRRPTVLPTPLVPLKLRFGAELVRSLLVEGQRVRPKRLEESGYRFVHPTLQDALRSALDA